MKRRSPEVGSDNELVDASVVGKVATSTVSGDGDDQELQTNAEGYMPVGFAIDTHRTCGCPASATKFIACKKVLLGFAIITLIWISWYLILTGGSHAPFVSDQQIHSLIYVGPPPYAVEHTDALRVCRLLSSISKFAPAMTTQIISEDDWPESSLDWEFVQGFLRAFLNWRDHKYSKARAALYAMKKPPLNAIRDDDLVLFVDASFGQQMLFTENGAHIAKTFQGMDLPRDAILMMVERNCDDCGHASLWWNVKGSGFKPLCNCSLYESTTSYKYIYPRAYIGRRFAVKAMLESWVCFPVPGIRNKDRNCAQELYFASKQPRYHRSFTIWQDQKCELFQSFRGTILEENKTNAVPFSEHDRDGWFRDGVLRNPETGSHPAVVLLNDQNFKCEGDLANQLLNTFGNVSNSCVARQLEFFKMLVAKYFKR